MRVAAAAWGIGRRSRRWISQRGYSYWLAVGLCDPCGGETFSVDAENRSFFLLSDGTIESVFGLRYDPDRVTFAVTAVRCLTSVFPTLALRSFAFNHLIGG